MPIRIGTAGWTIPRQVADRFPTEGSSLERYSALFCAVEINSSFYRPHRVATWERWRDSVPPSFRFSVKVPKTITHQAKLADCGALIRPFLDQLERLGDKLAVLLVQLPPKLELQPATATTFFRDLASRTGARIACEPRNASWFSDQADALLTELQVARVAADPPICEAGARPGGWKNICYWRLHGSPAVYRSSYGDRVESYARLLRTEKERGADVWCMFDNTASSAAASDALAMMGAVGAER